ncbi:MAG TPA: L-threonylcarbamoyladenylate synthase [Gaiella sp.]|nr:L-threonylcarbamoyladenylate synthase [Gaiella sp.]
MSEVAAAIEALRRGEVAVIPTDTVYGLAANVAGERGTRALYAAKRRDARRPTAILFASLDELLVRVPELPAEAVAAGRALLPGPVTLVLPNPERRYPWLNEQRPDTLGVRVPAVTGPGKEVLDALGALVATSANLPGGPDPRSLAEVPPELAAAAAAVVDGGVLAGTPSTVVDLTGVEPVVLREGALPAAVVLERLRSLTDR